MGGPLSTPSPDPSQTQSQTHHITAMSSKEEPSQTQEPKRTQNESSEAQNPDTQEPINPEEDEEGECGFCLFMKGGGCRDCFVAWEKCIEEAERNQEDIVDKCFEVTGALKKCMEAHSDYYAPILQAEKTAEEATVRELENENAEESRSSSSPSSRDSEERSSTKGSEQGLEKNEGS